MEAQKNIDRGTNTFEPEGRYTGNQKIQTLTEERLS
jgi:hypothetical protein